MKPFAAHPQPTACGAATLLPFGRALVGCGGTTPMSSASTDEAGAGSAQLSVP